MKVLELIGLGRTVKNNIIFQNVSLCVEQGECYAIVGRDNEGKTSIMEAALGLGRADEGEIRWFEGMEAREAFARIGYVPDDLLGFNGMTGAKFLDMVISMKKLGDVFDYAGELIEFFGIEPGLALDVMDDSMNKLTYIISVLLAEPEVLVLDEPFNYLDEDGVRRLKEFIEIYRRDKHTVLIVSDSFEAVADICGRFSAVAGRRQVAANAVPADYKEKMLVRAVKPDLEYLKHMLLVWARADRSARTFIERLEITRYDEEQVNFVMPSVSASVKMFLLALKCEGFITRRITVDEQLSGEGSGDELYMV